MTPIDPVRFRRLLGSFATGVCVVTAVHPDGRPAGITASAIASVSLDPPLVLVCVWHESDFHDVIATAERFAINVLADNQEAVSLRFASRAADRFVGIAWAPHPSGPPVLDGVSAQIVCARRGAHVAGDHTIFVGEVLDGEAFPPSPLLHVRGTYRQLR
jgi:flavin reductase (DIM6/NTAB) family NADH-FMN oxidoreductase RutF